MAETKLITLCVCALAAVSCGPRVSWEKLPVDGHVTSVGVPLADNVRQTIGTVKDGVYTSPNGRVFEGGAVTEVAQAMTDAQEAMKELKTVIGYAPEEMVRKAPECPLYDWIADMLICRTSAITGRKVDVSFANCGGVRADIGKGDVIMDDIFAMFPFNNYLTYISIKGKDLRKIYEQMGKNKALFVGGVQLVIRDDVFVSAIIGGEPLDDEKVYGMATLDFLLKGGDGFCLGQDAIETVVTGTRMREGVIDHIKALTSLGKSLEYTEDGRYTRE